MTCPHCKHSLTEPEVKSIWGAFCASQVPAHRRGGGTKPWPKHSPTAGLRCRCVGCNAKREARLADMERAVIADMEPEEMTWDTMLTVNPEDGYERLIAHEKARILGQRRHKLKNKLDGERYRLKLRLLKERAQKEKVWGKIKDEAKRQADEELPEED